MKSYARAIADLTEHFVRLGGHVHFLSTCQGVTGYADDSSLAVEIAAQCNVDRDAITVSRESHGPHELIRLFKEMDFVVATRMHAAILAWLAGTPVLPIAYEFKTTELFRAWAPSVQVLDIETIGTPGLVAAFDSMWQDRAIIASALQQTVRRAEADSLQAIAVVRRAVRA